MGLGQTVYKTVFVVTTVVCESTNTVATLVLALDIGQLKLGSAYTFAQQRCKMYELPTSSYKVTADAPGV